MSYKDNLPIPPLEPTYYSDGTGMPNNFRSTYSFNATPIHRQIIFELSLHEYEQRMEHERLRIKLEKDMTEQLREKTEMIKSLQLMVQDLHNFKDLSIYTLREAYANGTITLKEFESLICHCLINENVNYAD